MIGISEGIVLADRYRLVRRQAERAIGATWIATDTQTGSDVWVQFADRGGLAEAADLLGRHAHPAVPTVLDTGELRLVVNSRALAAGEGRLPSQATHVEIVIEFAVLKPLTGRALPPKIARRPLAPAEGLALAAGIAGALVLARGEGRSHGWLTADSVWVARRGGYAIDLAQGLAFPDDARIETEQEVTGYFAPERLNGGAASEAADVFALGWLLYETLIGHATLHAEYTRLVAGAGAVTTHELLALWRERARAHVVELLEADSALALLITASLAERPADRPSLDAFASGALEAAGQWKGAAALVGGVAVAGATAAVGAASAASAAGRGAASADALASGASRAAGVGLVGAEVNAATGSGAKGVEETEASADADVDAGSDADADSDIDSDIETATAGQALTLLSEAAAAALVVDGAINLASIPSQRTSADVASAAVGAAVETAAVEAESDESPVAESAFAESPLAESSAAENGAVESHPGESGHAEGAALESVGFAQGVQAAPLLAGGVIESTEIIENAVTPVGLAASPRHGRRHRALFSVAAVAILAIFVVGLSVGYAWGHHGTSVQSVAAAGRGSTGSGGGSAGSGGGTGGGGSSGSNAAGAPAVAAAAASASAACATPAATASGEALSNVPMSTVPPSSVATGVAAGGQASPAPPVSAPTSVPSLSPLPAPASNAVAIQELVVTVERGKASGVIGAAVTKELLSSIDQIETVGKLKGQAGPAWTSALGELALMIENDQQNRMLPTDLANQLSTTLSYLYGSSGS